MMDGSFVKREAAVSSQPFVRAPAQKELLGLQLVQHYPSAAELSWTLALARLLQSTGVAEEGLRRHCWTKGSFLQ